MSGIKRTSTEQQMVEEPVELSTGSGPMTLSEVYLAPGHLLRRAQQIAVAVFFEEFAAHNITPVQYGALIVINQKPGMTQVELCNVIAIDRSTIGTLLKTMEDKQLIRRLTPATNRRAKQLYITKKGKQLVVSTRRTIFRVQERILEPLGETDRKVFMSLLSKLVHVNNRLSRVPLKTFMT